MRTRVVFGIAVLIPASLAILGIYRTANSHLSPPVWPAERYAPRCWPSIDWSATQALTDELHEQFIEEALREIDDRQLPSVSQGLLAGDDGDQLIGAYQAALLRREFSGVPKLGGRNIWDDAARAMAVLERVHALLLSEGVANLRRNPAEALKQWRAVADATYTAAEECTNLGGALAWAVNLKRTLDVAQIACRSAQGESAPVQRARLELATWAAQRRVKHAARLDSLFFADYTEARSLLEELTRRRQWWIFTWTRYNANSVSRAVDACYAERFNLGVGSVWSRSDAVAPRATSEKLGRSGQRLADALCKHSTDAWEGVLSLRRTATDLNTKLKLLSGCHRIRASAPSSEPDGRRSD
jgi:hypothetical protein